MHTMSMYAYQFLDGVQSFVCMWLIWVHILRVCVFVLLYNVSLCIDFVLCIWYMICIFGYIV